MKLLQESAPNTIDYAAEYLIQELGQHPHFSVSQQAATIAAGFQDHLRKKKVKDSFQSSIQALQQHPMEQFQLALQWIKAFDKQSKLDATADQQLEAAYLVLQGQWEEDHVQNAPATTPLTELKGDHPVLESGEYSLNYTTFLRKLRNYRSKQLPQYQSFQEKRKNLFSSIETT